MAHNSSISISQCILLNTQSVVGGAKSLCSIWTM